MKLPSHEFSKLDLGPMEILQIAALDFFFIFLNCFDILILKINFKNKKLFKYFFN